MDLPAWAIKTMKDTVGSGLIGFSVDGWLDTQQPDITLLMIGTNDMFWDNGLSTGPGRLSALIDQITDQVPNTQLLVASIPPSGKSTVTINASYLSIRPYPALLIPRLLKAKVSFVDLFSRLTPSDLADGVHPLQMVIVK